mmetsp:Transcript_18684/g.32635  ORF Transcript_18684/g.32635 Transcript_18684/m.32635 type:complete len:603 (+) Transcript_18684:113-1921(+)
MKYEELHMVMNASSTIMYYNPSSRKVIHYCYSFRCITAILPIKFIMSWIQQRTGCSLLQQQHILTTNNTTNYHQQRPKNATKKAVTPSANSTKTKRQPSPPSARGSIPPTPPPRTTRRPLLTLPPRPRPPGGGGSELGELRGVADHGALDLAHAGAPVQLHGHLELRAQQLQHVRHALLARVGQAPEHRPPNEHGRAPQGQRLEGVGAAQHAAVHVDLAALVHGGHDLGHHLDGGQAGVQLARAVVGDPDAVHVRLAGHAGVLGRHHALHHHLHEGVALEPGDVLPVERAVDEAGHVGGQARVLAPVLGARGVRAALRGKVAHGEVRGQLEAVAHVGLAAAQHGRVHGDREGLVPRRLRAPHQVQHHVAVLVHVELEPAGRAGLGGGARLGHLLQRDGRPGAQRHQRARLGAGARGRVLAVLVGHALHGRRRNANGRRDLVAENSGGDVHLAHVTQDSGAHSQSLVSSPVLAQSYHIVRAAGVVVKGVLRHVLSSMSFIFTHIHGLPPRLGRALDGLGGRSNRFKARHRSYCAERFLGRPARMNSSLPPKKTRRRLKELEAIVKGFAIITNILSFWPLCISLLIFVKKKNKKKRKRSKVESC